MSSCVLGVQPSLGHLTTMMHPILLGLYSTFSKEVLVKAAKIKRGRQYADEEEEKLVLDGNILK